MIEAQPSHGDRCDGTCHDALDNFGVCDVCLSELCICGHTVGQHAYGSQRAECDYCDWTVCRGFTPWVESIHGPRPAAPR